jgi:large subunit ribosomal protein L3
MKVGMLAIWDKWGERHAVTVIHFDDVTVLQVKKEETDGYTGCLFFIIKFGLVIIYFFVHFSPLNFPPSKSITTWCWGKEIKQKYERHVIRAL